MDYMYAIDNSLDDREFRNVMNTLLEGNGFKHLSYDDPRIADDDPLNDNDILIKDDHIKYTVQTFLNKEITMEEVNETIEDIEKENVLCGLIITNTNTSSEIKKYAEQNNIEIWDRNELLKLTKKK